MGRGLWMGGERRDGLEMRRVGKEAAGAFDGEGMTGRGREGGARWLGRWRSARREAGWEGAAEVR